MPRVRRHVHGVPLAPRDFAVVDDRVALALETEELGGVDVTVGAGAFAGRDFDDPGVDDPRGALAARANQRAVARVAHGGLGHADILAPRHDLALAVPVVDVGRTPFHLDVVVRLNVPFPLAHGPTPSFKPGSGLL